MIMKIKLQKDLLAGFLLLSSKKKESGLPQLADLFMKQQALFPNIKCIGKSGVKGWNYSCHVDMRLEWKKEVLDAYQSSDFPLTHATS